MYWSNLERRIQYNFLTKNIPLKPQRTNVKLNLWMIRFGINCRVIEDYSISGNFFINIFSWKHENNDNLAIRYDVKDTVSIALGLKLEALPLARDSGKINGITMVLPKIIDTTKKENKTKMGESYLPFKLSFT